MHPRKSTIFTILLALGACSQEPLKPLETYFLVKPVPSGLTVNFCTDPAQVVKSRQKWIFIMDHSGSNINNYVLDPTTGEPVQPLDLRTEYATDPQKIARYGAVGTPGSLLDFLANTPDNDPADPKNYFAIMTFSNTYTPWPANGGFTTDVRGFQAAVQTIHDSTADQGSTNYLDPLRAAQSMIQGDINRAINCAKLDPATPPSTTCPRPGLPDSSAYVIVMVSDGSPILDSSTIPVTRQSSSEILGTVAGIMGLSANSRYVDSINLFTVYYYQPANPDPQASVLLHDMAVKGNGVSYNVTSGSNIDYRRFSPPSRLIKFTLADIFVTNANVAVGYDGTPHLDSDMDGLYDDFEIALGSSPTKADSDGNGVGDLVEFLTNGSTCGAKNAQGVCIKGSSTVNYAGTLCSGVSSSVINGNRVFAASTPDGLNNCENLALNNQAGLGSPDSNGDLIPNWLQFKGGIPFQIGTSSATETQDSDGVTYYQKIKTSLPPLIPLYRILNPKPTKYDMQIVSSSALQDCYRLAITDLPMAGNDNQVRVDVVMRSPLLQDRFLYKVGKKRFTGASKVLEINDWRDAGEIAAGTWRQWP